MLGSKRVKAGNRLLEQGADREQGVYDLILCVSISLMSHVPSSCPGKHWRLRSDDTEQHLTVQHIFLHPLYDPKTFENDVALVELSQGPVLNDFVMPICLPERPPGEGTPPCP